VKLNLFLVELNFVLVGVVVGSRAGSMRQLLLGHFLFPQKPLVPVVESGTKGETFCLSKLISVGL
jgi:hypothetical protein